jgi:hypothetical protein
VIGKSAFKSAAVLSMPFNAIANSAHCVERVVTFATKSTFSSALIVYEGLRYTVTSSELELNVFALDALCQFINIATSLTQFFASIQTLFNVTDFNVMSSSAFKVNVAAGTHSADLGNFCEIRVSLLNDTVKLPFVSTTGAVTLHSAGQL